MDLEARKQSLKKEILQTLTDINAVLSSVDRLMGDLQQSTDLGSSLAVAESNASKSLEGTTFSLGGKDSALPEI